MAKKKTKKAYKQTTTVYKTQGKKLVAEQHETLNNRE